MADGTNESNDAAFAGAEAAAAREAAQAAAAEDGGGEGSRPKAKVTNARATTAGRAGRRPAGAASDATKEAADGRPVMDPGSIGRVDGSIEPTATSEARSVDPDEIITTDTISITGGGIQSARARTVNVHQGGIGRLDADEVAISQGGIGAARVGHLSVELGGVGAVLAGDVRVTQGVVSSVAARDVTVEQSLVRSVVANHVTFGRTTGALVVIARRVDGEVRTLLDWKGAIAFGAVFGLVAGLFRRRR